MPIVVGIAFLVKGGAINAPFPKEELLKLVAPSHLLIFLFAGFVFFALMALIRHKSPKKDDQDRAYSFADIGLDEMASVLFSFGSLLLVCVFVGATAWYVLAALICYSVGYCLKPSE